MPTYIALTNIPIQLQDLTTSVNLSGGSLEFYLAGTSTPTNLYSDDTGTSIGTSITLNSGGLPESNNNVVTLYYDSDVAVDIATKNSSGTEVSPRITVKSPALSLTSQQVGGILYPVISGGPEETAGVVPVDYSKEYGHIFRYGNNAVPGTTDMLAACNLAISTGLPLYFPGDDMAISGPVDFTNTKFVHFDNTVFKPTFDTGRAFKIETTATNFVEGYNYTGLLTVDWPSADWTKDRESFYLSNVYNSNFSFSSINSTVFLRLYGNQKGVVYNDFHLGKAASNLIGVWLGTADSTGWCNANRFHGGFFLGSGSVTGSLYEANAGHIYIESSPYACVGNVFYSPSLEWVGAGYRLARMGGLRNTLIPGFAEVNTGDTTWIVDTGTKNTIDCFSTAYIDGYDPTLAGSANRLDVSGATEPYVLAPQGYVDFDGKLVQHYKSNHTTEPTVRANNSGGGPAISAKSSSDATAAVVIRNAADSDNSVELRADGDWTVQGGDARVKWRTSAAPVSGTYTQGDKVFYDSPSVDGNNMVQLGWMCTVGGTPGTWVAMYVSTVSPAT